MSVDGRSAAGTGGKVVPRAAPSCSSGTAGTAFRPLTAVLAFAGGEYKLAGAAAHARAADWRSGRCAPATGCAASITSRNEGYPPLADSSADGGAVRRWYRCAGMYRGQFLSALMMAAPLLGKPVRIAVEGELISRPYVRITLNMMKRFGVTLRRMVRRRLVRHQEALSRRAAGRRGGRRRLVAGEISVEGRRARRRPTSSQRARSAA